MDIFFKINKIGQTVDIPSRPEEDLGFSYETHEDYTILPNPGNFYTEAGLVKIEDLEEQIQFLKANGANYVACDWHSDHEELEVTGFEFRRATEEEILEFQKGIAKRDLERKEKEIKQLEEKLKALKSK